jgi:hypothetical protein
MTGGSALALYASQPPLKQPTYDPVEPSQMRTSRLLRLVDCRGLVQLLLQL